jgi:hypothetical protein
MTRKRKEPTAKVPRKKRKNARSGSIASMESEVLADLKAAIDGSGSNEISPRREILELKEMDVSFDDVSFAAGLLSNM